jgi:4-diphosphocytidyl-2-C-methyl-D-erythritol kinase
MRVEIPSFAKINIGLRIGSTRADRFHELRTVYQTVALHDIVRLSLTRGSGIEIQCQNPQVPTDSTNTCFRTVSLGIESLKARGRVTIEIEKKLPVQGGLGGASANAVTALLALERATGKQLTPAAKLAIAAEVGSDLPLFLIGGTVVGVGRGEEVYPLPDLPAFSCVIALPTIAISTPQAFAEWDRVEPQANRGGLQTVEEPRGRREKRSKLTRSGSSDKMLEFHHEIFAWLNAEPMRPRKSGVSAGGGGRAENLLLDLVRTGIKNDFEEVVFPQYPEMSEVKRVLQDAGASYASLSGSGSAIYGLFLSRAQARGAVKNLKQRGVKAVLTTTLPRSRYWKELGSVRA